MHEQILIIDFGSQYTQLIARRVRELNVYAEIHPFHDIPEDIQGVKGVILSGSPFSVLDKKAPELSLPTALDDLPRLGICYGAQWMAYRAGGKVEASRTREYGRAHLQIQQPDTLFKSVRNQSQVWMSHADTIHKLPDNCEVLAGTADIPTAAFKHTNGKPWYGLQFHPEVTHTEGGQKILENFVIAICGCSRSWTPEHFVEATVAELRKKIDSDNVLLGLSGGVDSSVAAQLLHRAIGKQLYCVFVNTGLLRKHEYAEVLEAYKDMGLNIIGVDASDRFLKALEGVSEPEAKRKIIGHCFIEVFDEEAAKLKSRAGVQWLAQGTIYPDVIESAAKGEQAVTIKSHHNVGGLPEKMKLKVVEPLHMLFKDEVRKVGRTLQLPAPILQRHPFPGPGLAIRILGPVTREKVHILQEADALYVHALREAKLYDKVWQAAAILLPVQTVGVMGDERTYEHVIALRAVTSSDGMTADWCHLPYDFLAQLSNTIINRIKGVNRVVYDISSKPPATIEWE